MNKIQFNTSRISVLADSIQSLSIDLDETISTEEKPKAFAITAAIDSMTESIRSEAKKIDQLCSEQAKPEPSNEKPESPTVVNIHKVEEAQPNADE